MVIHHAVIEEDVHPTDQTDLRISRRLRQGFSREHGWVPPCSEISFGVVECSIARPGMGSVRNEVNIKQEMGQCRPPT